MKKVLIVLLSVLLALTFISCEKDKSGEVIQNYEDFVNAYNADEKIASFCFNLISKYADNETKKVEDKEFGEKDNDIILGALKDCYGEYGQQNLLDLLDVKANGIEISEVKSVSGKLQGTYYNYTASDIVIKFKYTTTTYEEGTKEPKKSDLTEGELKFSVEYSAEQTEETQTMSISSLSVQGASYKDITCSVDKNMKATSATVGGAGVELRLLQPYLDAKFKN